METDHSVDALWRRFKSEGDRDARDRLVVHYSPLVKFVAGRVRSGLPSSVDQADLVSSTTAGWFNGDDAIVLRKGGAGGEIVDVIGQVGHDPGSEWGTGLVSTADNTVRRKVAVCAGDTNPADAFDQSVRHYDAQLAAGMKRTLTATRVQFELTPFRSLSSDDWQALTEAARRYGDFLGRPATILDAS